MQRINATLPTLGAVPVDFHRESAQVLELFGSRELERLSTVPHLGVASSVFTGVNHSRLEYLLLQCALIGLVGKLHRFDPELAISNSVSLNGVASECSSGEELLKCWSLLSNFGHAQYTYGVERAFLQQARRDAQFQSWLLAPPRYPDLRDWSRNIFSSYNDGDIHFLLVLKRVLQKSRGDRRKNLAIHALRNLVLPISDLFPTSRTQQHKLARLRELFRRIRLLSMTALDAYYSHNPVRLDLSSAIVGLSELTAAPGESSAFEKVVSETAGWLADELYLHSSATTAQREYEVRGSRILTSRFARAVGRPRAEIGFVNNMMWNGFGRPAPTRFVHLLRLTFPSPRHAMLGRNDLFDVLRQLETDLAAPPRTFATVDRNRFSRAVHVDLMYDRESATTRDVAQVYSRVFPWLVRSLEADALARTRALFRVSERGNITRIESLRDRFIKTGLQQDRTVLNSLFHSVLLYVLPEGMKAGVGEYMAEDRLMRPVWAKVARESGIVVDQITPEIVRHLDDNPRNYSADRLQDLRALRRVFSRSSASFVLGCTEKFFVRDRFGKPVDEWDGVIMEFSRNDVRIRIVEAKNLGSSTRNEAESTKQLRESVPLICDRRKLPYRIAKLAGVGAVLTCTLAV